MVWEDSSRKFELKNGDCGGRGEIPYATLLERELDNSSEGLALLLLWTFPLFGHVIQRTGYVTHHVGCAKINPYRCNMRGSRNTTQRRSTLLHYTEKKDDGLCNVKGLKRIPEAMFFTCFPFACFSLSHLGFWLEIWSSVFSRGRFHHLVFFNMFKTYCTQPSWSVSNSKPWS